MPSNAKEFAAFLRQIGETLPKQVVEPWMRKVAFRVLQLTVQNTPVNTGRLRNGWHLTTGSPSGSDTQAGDSASAVMQAGEETINGWQLGETLWLQNNVPYARVIEDGLYDPPDPGPSKATHVPKSRRGTVEGYTLVRGGYSVSAPNGMLADALQSATEEINAGGI